jgi:hypothetical protein
MVRAREGIPMRPLRVFVDTSVFGGMFDAEFDVETRRFFDAVHSGRFRLAVSDQVVREVGPAPSNVKAFFESLIPQMELLQDSLEVQRMTDLYLAGGVVTSKYRTDASYVAYATVHACAGLVSWNFSHIVHEDKTRLFNVVNAGQGYPPLFMATPGEITSHA